MIDLPVAILAGMIAGLGFGIGAVVGLAVASWALVKMMDKMIR